MTGCTVLPEGSGTLPRSSSDSGRREDGSRRPCSHHVGCAAALPCGHVSELSEHAVALVLGAISGPSTVVGIPKALLDAVRAPGGGALDHSARCGPLIGTDATSSTFAMQNRLF